MHVLRFRKIEFRARVDEGAVEHFFSLSGPFSNRFASWPRYIFLSTTRIRWADLPSAEALSRFSSSIQIDSLQRFYLPPSLVTDRRRGLACQFMHSRCAYRRPFSRCFFSSAAACSNRERTAGSPAKPFSKPKSWIIPS